MVYKPKGERILTSPTPLRVVTDAAREWLRVCQKRIPGRPPSLAAVRQWERAVVEALTSRGSAPLRQAIKELCLTLQRRGVGHQGWSSLAHELLKAGAWQVRQGAAGPAGLERLGLRFSTLALLVHKTVSALAEEDRAREREVLLDDIRNYSDIVNRVADGVWRYDANGRITFMSRRGYRMFGLARERLVGRSIGDLVRRYAAPEDRPRVEEQIAARRQGKRGVYLLNLESPSGRRVSLLVRSVPIILDGKFGGGTSIVADVTEMRRLHYQREMLGRVADAAGVGVMVVDSGWRVLSCSPAAAEMLGRPQHAVAGSRLRLLAGKQWPVLKAALSAALRGRHQPTQRMTWPHPTKREVHTSLQVVPAAPSPGQPSVAALVIRDLTQETALQERLARQNRLWQATDAVIEATGGSLEPQWVMQAAADRIAEVLPAAYVAIFLLDADGSALRLQAHHGLKPQHLQHWSSCKVTLRRVDALVREGTPILAYDAKSQPTGTARLLARTGLRSVVCVPLRVRQTTRGAVAIAASEPRAFESYHLRLLQAIADRLAGAIENARLYQEVNTLAVTDSLTGAFNRRYFEERLAREVQRAKRYHHPLCLAITDVNNFKRVNDTLGHPAGDRLLCKCVEALESTIRDADLLARYGGDEFAVILPETPPEAALAVAERMRLAVRQHCAKERVYRGFGVSLAVGIAAMPLHTQDTQELILLADNALLHAKRTTAAGPVIFTPDMRVRPLPHRSQPSSSLVSRRRRRATR